jgi:soluble lytic murein transglycosylase
MSGQTLAEPEKSAVCAGFVALGTFRKAEGVRLRIRRGDQRAQRSTRLLGALALGVLVGAVPASTAPDPVPVLREARTIHERGEPARAAQELAKLVRGPLADHAHALRARWLLEAGDTDAALAAAREALAHDPPSELRSSVYATLADIQLARDDVGAAYQAQRDAWAATRDSDTAAALAFAFAAQFEKHALPGDALALYRKVWRRWPRSSASGDAFARSRFLAEATGAPPPDTAALTAYADGLRTAYLCEQGLAVYERILSRTELTEREQRRAERGRADCLFQRRRYNEAHRAYAGLAKSNPLDVDAAIRAARSDARAGKRDEAVAALTAITKRGRPAEKVRAQYLVAVILSAEDPASSSRLFQRVSKQRESAGLARLARWRLAWQDLQQDRDASALVRLRPLTRGSLWDIEVQRARYWSAVAKLDSQPEKARQELSEIVEKIPLSYYGLLSADRLGVVSSIERSFLDEEETGGPFLPEQRTTWLLEAGFPDAARKELESWVRRPRISRRERMAAASLLHGTGDHFRAVRLMIDGFGGAFEQGIDPQWRSAWEYAWPQPFGGSVEAAVKEFEFDPALVYAIMREESTYRPQVESPAGALGLMQIIPPTGTRIADTLGVSAFAPELLFDPQTNIRFGTYYLKYLMGLFDGSMPLAIAAYNAGPDAVSDWITRYGHLPDDAFVDSVPYSETRRYLRKVLRSWRVYRLLYDGQLAAAQPE